MKSDAMIDPHDPLSRGCSFSEHISRLEEKFPEATGSFRGLMQEIMLAGKIISSHVRRAGLIHEMGRTGEINVQGEEVQHLDEFANEAILRIVGRSGYVCAMSSEEDAEIVPVPKGFACGKYTLTIDPLDGSSNIDVNVSTGTIFSIHERVTASGPGQAEDLLQPGHRQAAAGYILYGSSTMLVYAARECGAHAFTLDPTIGEFLLSHPNLEMPSGGSQYSVNEGHSQSWSQEDRDIVAAFRNGTGPSGRPMTARYIGSLVADFHRSLLVGGVFLYPRTTAQPEGKLRLLSEASPLAFIAEAAGGMAIAGPDRILDLEPTELHQRVPLVIGSKREVEFVHHRYIGKNA